MPSLPVVAVVGGGITGLAVATQLRALRPDARVIVLEAAPAVGGKLRSSEVGGVVVDEGADSMLNRAPDGAWLAAAAGLESELVAPSTGTAGIWTRGRVRPLPTGTLLGVPADLGALARSGLLSAPGLARVLVDLLLPGSPVADDVAVGALVERRLGREVVDRLVDPLLGGVYAGRADQLSLQATLPALAAAASHTRSLLLAARATRAAQAVPASASGPATGPVFTGLRGGLGRLPTAVTVTSGAEIRTGTTARRLARTQTGWRLTLGPTSAPALLDVDAVVLAVPGPPAARLLRDVVPAAAADVAALEYASVAIVTLVLAGPTPGHGSGYLVPAVEGRTTKAVTFASRKWAHLAGGAAVVRASVGRFGAQADLQRSDAELVASVLSELAQAVGPTTQLLASRVTRWGGALPQYAVGHLDRVRRVRAEVAGQPGLAVAGAAFDGVGVPACIASGRAAARAVLGHVRAAAPTTQAHNGGYDRS